MSRFKVGDRVRYVGRKRPAIEEAGIPSDPNKIPVGTEGVVVLSGYSPFHPRAISVEFSIRSTHPSGLFSCLPEWLAPIYDGNEPVSWADCVWKPKQVSA